MWQAFHLRLRSAVSSKLIVLLSMGRRRMNGWTGDEGMSNIRTNG